MISRYASIGLLLLVGCSQVLGIEELDSRETVDAAADATVDAAAVPDAGPRDAHVPDALPPGVYDHGWPDEFRGHVGVLPHKLLGFPVTIPHGGQVVGWGVIAHEVAGPAQARMALYDKGNYGPGRLVTASPAWQIRDGSVKVTGDRIAAGEYWLVLRVDTRFQIKRTNDTSWTERLCFRDLPFGEPFPDSFDAESCHSRRPGNLYISIKTY